MIKVLKYSVICSSIVLASSGGHLLASNILDNKDSKNMESSKVGMLYADFTNNADSTNRADSINSTDSTNNAVSTNKADFINNADSNNNGGGGGNSTQIAINTSDSTQKVINLDSISDNLDDSKIAPNADSINGTNITALDSTNIPAIAINADSINELSDSIKELKTDSINSNLSDSTKAISTDSINITYTDSTNIPANALNANIESKNTESKLDYKADSKIIETNALNIESKNIESNNIITLADATQISSKDSNITDIDSINRKGDFTQASTNIESSLDSKTDSSNTKNIELDSIKSIKNTESILLALEDSTTNATIESQSTESSTQSQNTESQSTESKTDSKDTKAAKAYKLEAVTATVSTASGYEQDIRHAPASIAVVPKEEILTRPIRDLGDAIQDIPGVYVEASKTGANTISMRGLGSAYTLILIDGKRQNVAQGFDGNGMSANTSFMPPVSMIERIEVIRGPASIIYGSDAMGGVINIITKKNPQKLSISMQAEAKLHEKHNVFGNIYGGNFYLATPIVKDKLSINLRGKYQYGEQNAFLKPSFVSNTTNNPYLSWSATGFQNANLGTRLNYILDSHNDIYLDLDAYFARLGSLNTSGRQISAIRDFYKFNGILNHDLNYDWGKITTYVQYSQTFWVPHAGVVIGATSGSSINWAQMRDNKDIVFQSTYNNLFSFDKWGDLVVNGGIYYLYERFVNKSSNFDRAMNQFAIFAEGQWNINDYIGLTLGLRYNYSDIFKAIPNPRFYINYNPFEWLTLKAGIASGVLVPNLSYLYDGYIESTSGSNTTYQYGNKDLRPETSWSYELGAIIDTKWAFATLTGYYTDFRDQIETNAIYTGTCQTPTTPDNCRTYRNLDKTLMAGFEFGSRLKPVYGFSLDLNYGFTYTRILTAPAGDEYLIGEQVNSIPRHSFTLTPRYSYSFNDNHAFDMYLRWNGRFQTPTPTPSGNAGNLNSVRGVLGRYYKDYQIVDLALTYKAFKKYYITLSANNLFDVNFIDIVGYGNYNAAAGTYQSYTNRYQRILPSRNYWLTFRVEF